MKKYRKDNTEVEAVQFDGSKKSFNEIKELLGDKVALINDVENDFKTFYLIGRNKGYMIYRTEWIVKDHYFFVVSDNVFQDMFTEIT